jgi:multidrug resistance efflux pump
VVKSPVAGLVRVMRNGDRQRQAGDQTWEFDAMVEIYPPENMDVLLRINEVDLRHLRIGQSARVVIPALKDREMCGEVVQLAGVGRDKFSRPEYAGKAGFADVVDFEVRVRLADTTGVELRQGMAARVEIALGQPETVLRLPLAAVQPAEKGGWLVRRRDGRMQPVEGAPRGPLWFAVGGGLAEGDEVEILRTRNR